MKYLCIRINLNEDFTVKTWQSWEWNRQAWDSECAVKNISEIVCLKEGLEIIVYNDIWHNHAGFDIYWFTARMKEFPFYWDYGNDAAFHIAEYIQRQRLLDQVANA